MRFTIICRIADINQHELKKKYRRNMELSEPKYEHLKIELDNYCNDLKNLYKNKLQENDKINTGNLINNFQVQVNFQGTEIVCTVKTVEYFEWVEHGRKPGKFPPLNKIEDWLETKNILPRQDETGKLPTQKSLAYLIGRKIAEEGIKPGNELAETQEELDRIYKKKFQDALQLDFNDYSGLINNEIYKMLNI